MGHGAECSAAPEVYEFAHILAAMQKAPPDHQKVLQELDRLLSEATDDASRDEILSGFATR